jgi:Na+/melibiose symporter-like transporter
MIHQNPLPGSTIMRLIRKLLLLHVCYSNSVLSLYVISRAIKTALISFIRRVLIFYLIYFINQNNLQENSTLICYLWGSLICRLLLFYLQQTEQSGVALKLQTFLFGKCSVRISAGTSAILGFRKFPYFLYVNAGVVVE